MPQTPTLIHGDSQPEADDADPMTPETEAELLRLSEDEGTPELGDLTEAEARREIARLKAAQAM